MRKLVASIVIVAVLALVGFLAVSAFKPQWLPNEVVETQGPFELDRLQQQGAVLSLSEKVEDAQDALTKANGEYSWATMTHGNALHTEREIGKLKDGETLKLASLKVEYSTRLRSSLGYLVKAKDALSESEKKLVALHGQLDLIKQIATPQAMESLEKTPLYASAVRDVESMDVLVRELKTAVLTLEDDVNRRLVEGL